MILHAYLKLTLTIRGGPMLQPNNFIDQPEPPSHERAHANNTLYNPNQIHNLILHISILSNHNICCASPLTYQPPDYSDDHCPMDPTRPIHQSLHLIPEEIPLQPYTREISTVPTIKPANNSPTLTYASHLITQNDSQRRKEKKVRQSPTRRSLRILEKRLMASAKPKNQTKTKTQMATLPFNLDSHQEPLDANMALAILQAFGLEINKRVEEMIEEATKKDHAALITDQTMPTTPLHDLVPPLAIPDSDLLL